MNVLGFSPLSQPSPSINLDSFTANSLTITTAVSVPDNSLTISDTALLQTSLDNLQSQISAQNTVDDSHHSRLTLVEDTTTDHDAQIDINTADILQNTNDILAIEAEQVTQNNNIASLIAEQTTQNTNIALNTAVGVANSNAIVTKQNLLTSSSDIIIQDIESHGDFIVKNGSGNTIFQLLNNVIDAQIKCFNGAGVEKLLINGNSGSISGASTCSFDVLNGNLQVVSPIFFNNGPQSTNVASCTRKDYVDGEISLLDFNIKALEAYASNNTIELGIVQTNIATLQNYDTQNTIDINALEAYDAQNTIDIGNIQTDINTLKNYDTQNTIDINALEAYDTQNTINIGNIQSTITTLQNYDTQNTIDINALEAYDTQNTINIGNLQSSITANTNLISSQGTAITTAQTNISTLQTQMNTAQSDILYNNSLIVDNQIAIADAQVDISGKQDTLTTSSSIIGNSLSIAPNTDSTFTLGNLSLGYSVFPNGAGFCHIDRVSATGYALIQSNLGETFFNSETGNKLRFSIGNVEKFAIQGSTATVTGTLNVTGNIQQNGVNLSNFAPKYANPLNNASWPAGDSAWLQATVNNFNLVAGEVYKIDVTWSCYRPVNTGLVTKEAYINVNGGWVLVGQYGFFWNIINVHLTASSTFIWTATANSTNITVMLRNSGGGDASRTDSNDRGSFTLVKIA